MPATLKSILWIPLSLWSYRIRISRRKRMRTLFDKSLVLLLLLAASVAAAEQPSRILRPLAEDPVRRHLERGVALEEIGLHKEAETQYLAALTVAGPAARTQITKALQRVREAQRNAESAKAGQRSDKHFQLGEEFQKQGRYEKALEAFQRAYNEADSPEDRARAQAAVVRVLEEKKSFWQQYIQDWLKPTLVKVLILSLFTYLLYQGLRFTGRFLARFSKRIEVSDFDDSTDSGFGKAFPAILRAAYQQYERLAKPSSTPLGSLLLAPRGESATLPIMVLERYQDFLEIGLAVPGIEVSKLLSKMARLLQQPYYTVSGAVYRLGEEIRVTTTLAKYNGVEARRDSILWSGPGANVRPARVAYEIIVAILQDWNDKTR